MPFTLTRTQQILIAALFASALIGLIISSAMKSEQAQTPPVLPDFSQFTDVTAKKSAFFDYMLPFVQQANAEIIDERQRIQAMDFKNPSRQEQAEIQALLTKYRLDTTDITPEVQQALLKKVDIISPSLALAQAANESSWGTSRFAREAYNFYGQWCFTKGCGLVPKQRSEGMVHEVKTFNSPYESVKGYMHNLNSHPYFKPLREQRFLARQANQPPTGLALASGLIRYSERKEEYIKEIRSMIRSNKLHTLDKS